jgi:hypothetical protein
MKPVSLSAKCCNDEVDIGKLDGDREFAATFKSLFRTPSDFRDYGEAQPPLPASADEAAAET